MPHCVGVAAELAQARVSHEVGRSIAACVEVVAAGVDLPADDGPELGRAKRLWNAIRKRLRRDRTGASGEETEVATSAGVGDSAPVPAPEQDRQTIEEGTMSTPVSGTEPTAEDDPKVSS